MRLTSPADVSARGPAFEAGTFVALLEPRHWSAIQLMGRVHAFPRGAILMYEGEPGDHVMVLLEGRVKVTRLGVGGQELVLSICGPGEILGELPCIDGEPCLASVEALEPVRVEWIEGVRFRRCLQETPQLAEVLLAVLSHRFRAAALKQAEFMASDTIGRLAARLVELADRYGQITERGIVIGLPLSQEELGGWVGACHAGLARALQVLRELGWIETERRRIVVRDLDALRSRSA